MKKLVDAMIVAAMLAANVPGVAETLPEPLPAAQGEMMPPEGGTRFDPDRAAAPTQYAAVLMTDSTATLADCDIDADAPGC